MKISVARVIRPRGFKGELAVIPYRENSKSLKPGLEIALRKDNLVQNFVIESMKALRGRIAVKLRGIDDEASAMAWIGGDIQLEIDDLAPLENGEYYNFQLEGADVVEENGEHPTSITEAQEQAVAAAKKAFNDKLANLDEFGDRLLSLVMLNVLDEKWKDHLYDLDQLRNAIHYRSWGQKDPLIEYKQEAYSMFVDLMKDIRKSVASLVFRAQLIVEAPPPPPQMILSGPTDTDLGGQPFGGQRLPEPLEVEEVDSLEGAISPLAARRAALAAGLSGAQETDLSKLRTSHGEDGGPAAKKQPVHVDQQKQVGRNDPCWCGSGKKFKKCHGASM